MERKCFSKVGILKVFYCIFFYGVRGVMLELNLVFLRDL